ncbi:MAG: HAMP domain-containing protein [Chloroflexaceae bacterium]|nr:HAMP domain-containing protein [Chloroflexaceae bacterium]
MKPASFTRFQSVQLKIAFWAGLCLFLAATIMIAYAALSLQRTGVAAARERAVAIAESRAAFIDAEIEVPLDTARTLAQTLSAVKREEAPLKMTREQANSVFQELLVDNPDFLGVFTLWEPDAFDGRDSRYVNAPGHDETGRFMAYWNRNREGQIQVETPMDYAVEGAGNYYQCPKQEQNECVVGPYRYPVQGEEVLMSSQVAPIIHNGVFYGVGGVDLRLDYLQAWADEFDAYDGSATLALISYDGTLVAVSGRPDLIGQPLTALHERAAEEGILGRIQRGDRVVEFNVTGDLEVYMPIEFGRTRMPWCMNIKVPGEQISAEAMKLVWQLVGISVVLTLVALVVLWFIAGQIARPIKKITAVAQEVAAGNLDVEADGRSKDEMGVLARSFAQMIGNLRQMIENERTAREEAARNAGDLQSSKTRIETTVTDYLGFVEQVAGGNLTARLSLDQRRNGDALVTLGQNLNEMAESLLAITGQVQQASVRVASAAAEILAATTEQASSAAQQSSAITQATTTVEEVRTIAQQTAQQAGQASRDSQSMLQVARRGTKAVEDTVSGMGRIRQRVEGIAQTILALSEQTQAIGTITITVSELADQSNMLALNAAIEAARAGEQGKSFAVVAQQVRELAERSKAATVQVQEILEEIQRSTNAAVMVTEEGTKGVEEGVKLSGEAGQVIHQIAMEIEAGAQSNTQIAAAAHQQMTGIEQIGQAMRAIQQATTQSLASTRQAERAARDLHTLAQSLQQTIAMYRLQEG